MEPRIQSILVTVGELGAWQWYLWICWTAFSVQGHIQVDLAVQQVERQGCLAGRRQGVAET